MGAFLLRLGPLDRAGSALTGNGSAAPLSYRGLETGKVLEESRWNAMAPSALAQLRRPAVALCAALVCLFSALALTTSPAAAASNCPNAVFREGKAFKLPDCRAYELVTPRYTAGLSMEWTWGITQLVPGAFKSDLVSADGDRVIFNIFGGA